MQQKSGEGTRKTVCVYRRVKRFKQELEEYNPKDKGFMYMHALEKHGGDMDMAFKVQRHSIDSDPMRRILREGLRIEQEMMERK